MKAGGLAALLLLAACIVGCGQAHDNQPADTGEAARRIVTLAPHLAELIYAIGAEEALVGVSAYSDYPPAVLDLPVVGDAFTIDEEALRLLEPDLLIVWQSGMPQRTVDDLRAAGFSLAVIRTQSLADVASALRELGVLTGKRDAAERVAREYESGIDTLAELHRGRSVVSVFYQISSRPLYTFGRNHFVTELIELCGGRNIFDDIDDVAPSVDAESVIARDPEVMLAPGDSGSKPFGEWDRWPSLAANRNRFVVPADELGRATPRLITGGEAICARLDEARERQNDTSGVGD